MWWLLNGYQSRTMNSLIFALILNKSLTITSLLGLSQPSHKQWLLTMFNQWRLTYITVNQWLLTQNKAPLNNNGSLLFTSHELVPTKPKLNSSRNHQLYPLTSTYIVLYLQHFLDG